VELSAVGKVYSGAVQQPALQDVSFELQEGEFTYVMGPSGSGKSTLLNLIAGLDRPTTGRLVVGGEDLGRKSETALARYRSQRIGMIFQFFNLLNNLTALENVTIPARLAGTSGKKAREMAVELMAQLGIADKAGKFPATLSGGERQRVAIARAVINRPVLLLADEPTGALDSRTGKQVMDLLVTLNAAGQTILLVTHDVRMAEAYAKRVITLEDGRVVSDGGVSPTVDGVADDVVDGHLAGGPSADGRNAASRPLKSA